MRSDGNIEPGLDGDAVEDVKGEESRQEVRT